MSRFKIGQKIVCIKTHSQGVLKKGKIYAIKKIRKSCCCFDVDIGIVSTTKYANCGFCKISRISDDTWWINESLFAPLEEDGSTFRLTKEVIEELELETIEVN